MVLENGVYLFVFLRLKLFPNQNSTLWSFFVLRILLEKFHVLKVLLMYQLYFGVLPGLFRASLVLSLLCSFPCSISRTKISDVFDILFLKPLTKAAVDNWALSMEFGWTTMQPVAPSNFGISKGAGRNMVTVFQKSIATVSEASEEEMLTVSKG